MTTNGSLQPAPAALSRGCRGRQFDDVLALLDAFIAENCHANPARPTTTEDGFRLGTWVAYQRTKHTQARLSADEHDTLARRGVHFPADNPEVSLSRRIGQQVAQERFAEQLSRVDAFISEHGHARISLDYVSPDGTALGDWIGTMRLRRNKGILSEDWITALDERGIEWAPKAGRKDYDRVFAARLVCLDAFIAEHGHASPTKTYRCAHPTCKFDDLGQWVLRARKKYRGAIVGPLSPEQVDALEQRGFEWTPKRRAAARRA